MSSQIGVQAVALCRVSTSKQRIYGNSLEAQEKRILEAAMLLEVNLPDEYIWRMDVSSKKGKNLKRKDLKEILETCKKNKRIKYFIVDEPDRFMRSIAEFYWWKIEFQEIGVELRFAHKPLANDDDQTHVFDEMIDVYRAESSNHERTRKANEKMQSRIDLGYYPGYHHTGYMTSDVKGLHVPKEPEFSQLKEAFTNVANGKWTMRESLTWLTESGFRLPSGKKLDMTKLRRIYQEPYYYGAVKMGNFKQNENGLHEPMITYEQYEIVSRIARGQKARFKINSHNPSFTMNLLLCEECFVSKGRKDGKFTGYEHHNGKKGDARKYYKRYRCRGCNMPFKRDELHDLITSFVSKVKLDPAIKNDLIKSLRKAWAGIEQDNLAKLTRLKHKLEIAQLQKQKLVLSMAENPSLQSDFLEAIALKKEEIRIIEAELSKASDIESDFVEFTEFALDFVDNLKAEWWNLDHEDRLRCEQLLFPQLLRVTSARKVSTPEISAIYRYKPNQKAPEGALVDNSGGTTGA